VQTNLADFIKDTPDGRDADEILRKCVHCGFCTATCPTYQILGDELDGPRGRIYLMKQALEGQPVTNKTQLHLDRCLTCRSCETTCPSGVHYSRLLDIGRRVVDSRVQRSLADRFARAALRKVVTTPVVFDALVRTGELMRPLLPEKLRQKLPPKIRPAGVLPQTAHARRMLVLGGCVQPALSPATNAAAARVLDRLGISLVAAERAGCCGAVSYHLSAEDEARDFMRRNIDAWWPHIEGGSEAVVITASGCGTMVKDYGHHLSRDPEYAEKAARVSELTKDISEVVLAESARLSSLIPQPSSLNPYKVAFHPPCTLQHGLKIRGEIEGLLLSLGVDLVPVRDAHLCCGSAGTYSILHPELAGRLRENKIAALTAGEPDEIVTANIGCQTHLQGATTRPVRHWIELVDELLTPRVT
jgi:glycolate oxidase iron-sulfur subunit